MIKLNPELGLLILIVLILSFLGVCGVCVYASEHSQEVGDKLGDCVNAHAGRLNDYGLRNTVESACEELVYPEEAKKREAEAEIWRKRVLEIQKRKLQKVRDELGIKYTE